ncbi:hypothetical protein E2C01_005705 [Portunus trituberculatus]|uniref:Uncharacterized protein n=1 Tax=Portunus trituberculatus TaxID=210409 RepID=A0A5B7CXB3_PORTR|nr:hypothetical protein [Portunus trituberculatus]
MRVDAVEILLGTLSLLLDLKFSQIALLSSEDKEYGTNEGRLPSPPTTIPFRPPTAEVEVGDGRAESRCHAESLLLLQQQQVFVGHGVRDARVAVVAGVCWAVGV